MQVVILCDGSATCLYSEVLDLRELGSVSISRASQVEPDSSGNWQADLAPVAGPVLGPFAMRSEALAAEIAWLETHRLGDP